MNTGEKEKAFLTKWLDAIQGLLKARGITVAQLAKDLNKNYILVYKWIVYRSVEPKGGAVLSLVGWALCKDPGLIRLFGKTFSR